MKRKGGCFLALFFLLTMTACHESNEEMLAWARAQPRENILQYSEVENYLKKYKVYISMTTSPSRISYVADLLKVIDLEYIDTVFLALPEHYGPTNEEYVIPKDLKEFPKLHILRFPKDYGPISKLVPAALKLQNQPEAILITIDDDYAMP